ncbi:TPA: chemotaxis protein, partial [Burkholderia multivorans]|nr:chemotaxis protein [Burkholderia multivorans]
MSVWTIAIAAALASGFVVVLAAIGVLRVRDARRVAALTGETGALRAALAAADARAD